MKHLSPYAVAIAASMIALPAFAQKIGTYTGTNDEGDQVEVVVSAASGGGFEITGLSDGGTVYCLGGTDIGYGVGFGGDLAAITDGKASYTELFTTVAVSSTFKFTGSEVTGKIKFSVPILLTARKGVACATKPQTFKATFGSDAPALQMPKGAYAWPLSK